MKGADIVVTALEKVEVDIVFAYPGGASMELHQALTRSKKIRTILPRHEQGGVFEAEGYARASGKVGVCIATSGPGATNLITGIADAYMDSIPLVAITGQVPQHFIGKNAFQETDIVGVTRPIVKHNYLVQSIEELPRIIKEAFYIASTGRPGPVVVDIPKNIQQAECIPHFPEKIELKGYKLEYPVSEAQIEQILKAIETCEKPVIYAGGGIISSAASDELLDFVKKSNIPITTTLMGIGCFPETHPLSMRWFGMHGTVAGNYAVDEADLLLAFGVRFDDRVTGKVEEFASHGTIVHVDIDPSEINKNKVVHIPVVGNIKEVLKAISKKVKSREYTGWHQKIQKWMSEFPFKYKDHSDKIMPQYVLEQIDQLTHGEAIITTGVGQHQMWAGQFIKYTKPRSFITSAGLGSMGFGLPAAIGAKLACPKQTVIDIDGDGSFVMNVQELATAYIDKVDVKIVILNNQHLGMVVQWEDRFYKGNRGHTFIGDPSLADPTDPQHSYPNFVKMAESFKIQAQKVIHKKDLRGALEKMLAHDGPYLLDIIVPYQEHVLPMIPGGKTVKDIIIE
ncbi:MAG: biosynthetic-type acetolactate synthase large subunit [Chlamydiae bacterium]|nr:biosynthetic-type acetolactate synthase large subunit [Chlamydiota bacterium]MBI3276315.1 biosynthetic-type acetolactate synthase large subunit [Chlamydiota bacterium]